MPKAVTKCIDYPKRLLKTCFKFWTGKQKFNCQFKFSVESWTPSAATNMLIIIIEDLESINVLFQAWYLPIQYNPKSCILYFNIRENTYENFIRLESRYLGTGHRGRKDFNFSMILEHKITSMSRECEKKKKSCLDLSTIKSEDKKLFFVAFTTYYFTLWSAIAIIIGKPKIFYCQPPCVTLTTQ